ncbi:Hsp20/alpha crystallin family protein [Cryobacterium sp. PH31-AA6]|uniref:Hsp20/alpha crystallin family protein n=1 Tax=Cryobacterium sp. PH31-AA6 TaxID=3046205 RepID=UPI0024BBB79E|nr:Hsp20/alpha crystallin family protein [Cryobacterium sp. PH31-AA6]MDJ0323962.1 Hsp20/alpha crystallin family protein [Cryobacterium sp. PH31-AA6]
MAGPAKRERSEVSDSLRRFFDGDWDVPAIRVEVFTDGNTLVVKAELPGIDPDKDVDISVSDGMLHIRAEREETSEQKEKVGYRSEFRYGTLSRDLTLPPGSVGDDVTASYRDGVLEVRVPLPAVAAKRAKIPIRRD